MLVDGKDATTLRLTVTGSLDPAVKALAAHPVVDLISQLPDLEDVFMTFYEGEHETSPGAHEASTSPRAEGGDDAA